MKAKVFLTFALLCAVAQGAWATDYNVGTDSELRAAIGKDGANIIVTADINLSNSTLSIATGTTVTIDLGGHTLDRKLTKRGEGGGQVITVREGATLNLSNGTLKGGWGGNSGGISNEGGTANLTDVIITGCTGDDRGGGISNSAGGTLNMTGGAITNNKRRDREKPAGGGGIFNAEGATATLTGVTITGNDARNYGGGGINNWGTLTLDGCTITGNTSKDNGSGVWSGPGTTLNMQGRNIVADNMGKGRINNVYLREGVVITVTGRLAGSSIGISLVSETGTFTSGYSVKNSSTDPATIFMPDLSEFLAVTIPDNEVQLVSTLPDGAVHYIEHSWDEERNRVKAEIKSLTSDRYTVLTGGDNVDLQSGYYVVKGNVTYNQLNMVKGGNHHLILCDGAKLVAKFIKVEGDNALHIYGQTNDPGRMEVTQLLYRRAAIGGDEKTTNGPIFIHGGDILAEGGPGSAGIGGGYLAKGGDITIYGGKTNAVGGRKHKESDGETDYDFGGGAGIGGGWNGNGGNVVIYGGDVQAKGRGNGAGIGGGGKAWDSSGVKGGKLTVMGGIVSATGGDEGAGIGGGYSGEGATVTVSGGEVYGYGGDRSAGIGGGRDARGGTLNVHGGYVYAQGGSYAAGIGSGCEALFSGGVQGGTVTITGGKVEAYGGTDAAGIGGGEDADGGTVNISGGYVYAEGKSGGAGIGGGEEGDGGNVTITGGTVIAKAGREASCSAIGSGYDCDVNGSLTLGDDRCVYITSNLWRSQKANRVSDCWAAAYLQISECHHGDATVSVVNGEKHSLNNCKWCYVTGEESHVFDTDSQCAACKLIRLEDEGDNSARFSKWADGNAHDFLLSGRKLETNEEGSRAYTVCLPFDMDLTDRKDDLSLWTLAYIKDSKEMVFTQTERKVEAGKPYLVVIHKGELELLGHSKLTTTPDKGVRIYDWDNREQPVGWWRGTLTKIESADAADMMAYALQKVGDFRRIRHDTPYAWWGAFRSMYCPDELPGTNKFTINRGSFNGLGGQTVTVSFAGDADIPDDATGIREVESGKLKVESSADAWYTLDGRIIAKGQKPKAKGLYINNGRKVVIK